MDKVLEVLVKRRSVRKYQQRRVEREKLQLLLDAAIEAPCGGNSQPWHFTVIDNSVLVDKLAAACKQSMAESDLDWAVKMAAAEQMHIFYHAPAVIVISTADGAMTADEDAAAAAQNIMLQAASMDLGSCWVGMAWLYFEGKTNYAEWGIPEDHTVKEVVAIGYPDPSAPANKPLRKPLSANWLM